MNVDKAVRKLNKMIIDDFLIKNSDEQKKEIYEFIEINDKEKPISFRQKDYNEILFFVENVNSELKKTIENISNEKVLRIIEDSNNNKIGSDVLIYFKNGNKLYGEIKFGSQTNANIGIDNFSKIFIFKNKSVIWKNIFGEIKDKQRELFDKNNDISEIELIENLEKIVNDIAINLNKEEIIINNDELNRLLLTTGSPENIKSNFEFLKFKIKCSNKVSDLVEIIDDFKPAKDWKIEDISFSISSKHRLQFIVSNTTHRIKFLLNWKNDCIYKKRKFKAKCALGTSSFNVWVYNKK